MKHSGVTSLVLSVTTILHCKFISTLKLEHQTNGKKHKSMKPKHILFNEDCFTTFARIRDSSIDMVLCDPPYGTTACRWDSIIPLEPMWEELKRIIRPNCAMVFTASQPFTSKLVMSNIKQFKYEWIWEKNRGSNFATTKYQPMKEHENVVVFSDGRVYYKPQLEEESLILT